jgi:hypothetical protein
LQITGPLDVLSPPKDTSVIELAELGLIKTISLAETFLERGDTYTNDSDELTSLLTHYQDDIRLNGLPMAELKKQLSRLDSIDAIANFSPMGFKPRSPITTTVVGTAYWAIMLGITALALLLVKCFCPKAVSTMLASVLSGICCRCRRARDQSLPEASDSSSPIVRRRNPRIRISSAGRYRPQEVESAAARLAPPRILSSSSEEEIPLPRLRAATFGGTTLEGSLPLRDSPDADTTSPTLEECASQRLRSPIGTKVTAFVNGPESDPLETTNAPRLRSRASTTSLILDSSGEQIWKRNLGDFKNILLTGYMKTGTISTRVVYDPDLDIIVDHTGKTYPRAVRPTTLQLTSYLQDIAEMPLPPLKMIEGIVCLRRHDQVRWLDSRKQWMNVETGQKILGFRAPTFDDLQKSGLFRSPHKSHD